VYFGFTLAMLLAERDRYVAAVQAAQFGGNALTSASENGSAFAFGPRGDLSLAQWQTEIQRALNYMDPCAYPLGAPSRTTFTMR
jgi:hypothetical protein